MIIEAEAKMFHYHGLKEWSRERGYLTDACPAAQDKYRAYLDYFGILYCGGLICLTVNLRLSSF